jgi:hypothetical protein
VTESRSDRAVVTYAILLQNLNDRVDVRVVHEFGRIHHIRTRFFHVPLNRGENNHAIRWCEQFSAVVVINGENGREQDKYEKVPEESDPV